MKQTDIEIYLKDCDLSKITPWLTSCLGECTPWQQKNKIFKCETHKKNIEITWYEKAVGSWHCLYLASEHLPWTDDLQCALDANKNLHVEIRCAPNGWTETEDNQENTWLKITNQNISNITWNT